MILNGISDFKHVRLEIMETYFVQIQFMKRYRNLSTPNAWCPQKGHPYLKRSAAESCSFIYVCVTLEWIPDIKGLTSLNFQRIITSHLN